MKPTLEIFPGGSRSPDVLAAEPPRSARDPFPREFFGWSELDVSRSESIEVGMLLWEIMRDESRYVSKKHTTVLSKAVGVVSIRCIMDGFCKQPSMACLTALPHSDTPRRRNRYLCEQYHPSGSVYAGRNQQGIAVLGSKLLSGARYMIGEDGPASERSMIHILLGLWGLQIYHESLRGPRIRSAAFQRSLAR